MHSALYVEEILFSIFAHCFRFKRHGRVRHPCYANRDLVALARTCRTFKELALDMVWAELPDLTPLVRCLQNVNSVDSGGMYSLKRKLENAEWEILRNYTSRVRVLIELRDTSGLAVDCINQLSNPPNPDESFFPRLQNVALNKISTDLYPFVLRHFTNPRLKDLTLMVTGDHGGSIFRSFGHLCPNVDYFKAIESGPHSEIISDLICHWSNLRHVICNSVVPNFNALSHLSDLSTLLSLSFTTNDTLGNQFPNTVPLSFSALNDLSVRSESLQSLWMMFRHISLPVLSTLNLSLFRVRPILADLQSVFAALVEACSHESLTNLNIWMPRIEVVLMNNPSPYVLTFNLIRALTVFHNLQYISLDVDWGVDLNESELLCLASSWPRLQRLQLGTKGNWTPSSGITPDGFVQLLERCRSLRALSAIFNTLGYTEIPRGHPWRGLTMPKDTSIHLLNSPIEEDSIHALGAFFQVAPYPDFNLTTHWNNHFRLRGHLPREHVNTYYSRWVRARGMAMDLSESRGKLLKSIRTRAAEASL